MSELSYKQEVELLTQLAENLNEGHHDYEQVVAESIDSIMPVYYTDLVQEWTEAGMPDGECDIGTILEQMNYALYSVYSDFAYTTISGATDTTTAHELVQEALGQRQGYAGLAEAIIR